MSQTSGIGLCEPIIFAPKLSNNKYRYRTKMGMFPSAEWAVVFEDFMQSWIPTTSITNGPVANTPLPWQGAIIDAGATVSVQTTATIAANGVLTFADASASEGAAIYGQKSLQLVSGKKFFMEMRCRTDDVTDNALQFGLSDLTATTNPEDLWTTTAANVLAFGLLDGSAYPQLLADEGNAGTAAITQTVKLMTVDTWHILGLGYDGVNVRAYVDGTLVASTATTVPESVALAPFIGHINGNGAGGNGVFVDYIRWSSER
jgi:hypothetical protein